MSAKGRCWLGITPTMLGLGGRILSLSLAQRCVPRTGVLGLLTSPLLTSTGSSCQGTINIRFVVEKLDTYDNWHHAPWNGTDGAHERIPGIEHPLEGSRRGQHSGRHTKGWNLALSLDEQTHTRILTVCSLSVRVSESIQALARFLLTKSRADSMRGRNIKVYELVVEVDGDVRMRS
jgi:hypothetical protein